MRSDKNPYATATLKLAAEHSQRLPAEFLLEVSRLMHSGALPESGYSRAVLFRVALENVTGKKFGDTGAKGEYANLKKF